MHARGTTWLAAAGAFLLAGFARAVRNRHPGRPTVLYDGGCRFCVGWVRWLRRVDEDVRLSYLDSRDGLAVAARFPSLSGADLLSEMHLVFPDGTVCCGFDAVRSLSAILPALRWSAPLLYLPGIRPIGVAAYRFVAARRFRGGACDGSVCGSL